MAGHHQTLVGRERERERIRTQLEAARTGRGSALILAGDPGIGKSALLADAEQAAEGFTCVWAHGVQGQSPALAGLLEALAPLRRYVGALPTPQAAALGTALGWEAGAPATDPFLRSAATMSLLSAAAEVRPVLLIDDLQWLDEPSASALRFAVGRLHRDRVAVLASAPADFDPAGLPCLPSRACRLRLPATCCPRSRAPWWSVWWRPAAGTRWPCRSAP